MNYFKALYYAPEGQMPLSIEDGKPHFRIWPKVEHLYDFKRLLMATKMLFDTYDLEFNEYESF